MAKSIKFKDNTFIDSSGVTHNKLSLKTILEEKSSRVVNTKGWYRIARIDNTAGQYWGSAMLAIYQSYSNYTPETHTILVSWCFQNAKIQILDQGPHDSNTITKYRIACYSNFTGNGGDTFYVEAYFNGTANQGIYVQRLTEYTNNIGVMEPSLITTTPTRILNEVDALPNEVVLYNGGATQADITLSESAANFKRLKIYYCQTAYLGTSYNTVEVPDPNGKVINISELILLETLNGSNYNGVYGLNRSYTISGTSIKLQHQRNNKFVGLNGTGTWGVADAINIVKVIGYRSY